MTLQYATNAYPEAARRPEPEHAALARLAWEVAVDQLALPGHAVIVRDDGTDEAAVVLSLLDQVAEAVMPGNERNGSVGGPQSRPPAALGALALVAEIRQEIRRCCGDHEHEHPENLPEQARIWASHAEEWQHSYPDYVLWAAEQAAEWVRQARLLLDPPPRYSLRGRACPTCGADSVQVWSDEESEYIRRPALSIDPEQLAAVCAACSQTWPIGAWMNLAAASENPETDVTGDTPD